MAAMKGIPSSLETLLWVYHFHSSTEVRQRQWPLPQDGNLRPSGKVCTAAPTVTSVL